MSKYKIYAKSSEALLKKCDEYFRACDTENAGNKMKRPYTVSGLCFYLGIGRDELFKLAKKRSHADLCREVMLKIESFIEENALLGALANNPALYCLKYNFGWTDKPQRAEESEQKGIKITLDGECEKWAN